MNKFNNNLLVLISCFFLFNCSFDRTTGFWNDIAEDLAKAKSKENTKLIFSSTKKFDKEIQSKQKIVVSKPYLNKNWKQQNLNNGNLVPHLIYENKKNLILKSKKLGKNSFSIVNADFQPIIDKDMVFFYDPSGNIIGYSIDRKKLVWKYNFYKKRYKNIPKEISIYLSNNNLIVSDNLGFLYSLNKNSGKIQWAKSYGVPFRSNIKLDQGNIFLVNQDNKFYVVGEDKGEQRLDLETFPSFLKTQNKASLSLDDFKKNIYFITSAAEIYSVNYRNRNINWLFNLTGAATEQKVDLFYSSPLIFSNNEIFVSTSLSTFSMNSINGVLKWDFPFNSKISPIILENYVFLISEKGFVVSLDRRNGNVIWSQNLFKNSKKLKYDKTGDITSILFVSDQIFLTTEQGYFIFLDYQNGKVLNYSKVSKGFFSKPVISNKTILIIDNKMRVLQFN